MKMVTLRKLSHSRVENNILSEEFPFLSSIQVKILSGKEIMEMHLRTYSSVCL